MSLRYLLDTMIVSSPVTRTPNPEILKRLEAHGPECAICAPVWSELIYGCRRMTRGKRRDAVERYLSEVVLASFPVLPYDEAAAHWHGLERARLETAGKRPPFVDGQIAAIARIHSLRIVTENARDFAAFEGIELSNWSKARR